MGISEDIEDVQNGLVETNNNLGHDIRYIFDWEYYLSDGKGILKVQKFEIWCLENSSFLGHF